MDPNQQLEKWCLEKRSKGVDSHIRGLENSTHCVIKYNLASATDGWI